jgi:hypothetical protein
LCNPPHGGCAGGRMGTRFLRPRGTSPLKGVNPTGTPGYRNGTESFFGLKGRPSVVIMLIMSCNTRFFNVRRGWKSLNTGPRFYLRPIRRTGWLWISTSRTTDGRPFKPKKLSEETCCTGKIIRPYPSPFLVSSLVAFKFLNVLVLNIAEKLNRRTPLQAEEALGPISIPRGTRGVDPF